MGKGFIAAAAIAGAGIAYYLYTRRRPVGSHSSRSGTRCYHRCPCSASAPAAYHPAKYPSRRSRA